MYERCSTTIPELAEELEKKIAESYTPALENKININSRRNLGPFIQRFRFFLTFCKNEQIYNLSK